MRKLAAIGALLMLFGATAALACSTRIAAVKKAGPTFTLQVRAKDFRTVGWLVELVDGARRFKSHTDEKGQVRFENVPAGTYGVLVPVGHVEEKVEVVEGKKPRSVKVKLIEPQHFRAQRLSGTPFVPDWMKSPMTYSVFAVSNGARAAKSIQANVQTIDVPSADPGLYVVDAKFGDLPAGSFVVEVDPKAKDSHLHLDTLMTTCGPYWKRRKG
jgi:hypothetical protein